MFALKEIPERLARREYRLLRELQASWASRRSRCSAWWSTGPATSTPCWSPGSWTTRRPTGRCSPTRAAAHLTDRLLDALVELLARLHLAGFMWGDCSLSNTLFRLDAGALAAYLVDAETAELHRSCPTASASTTSTLALERVAGELFDLQAGGLLPTDIDPIEVGRGPRRRYHALWSELTGEEVVQPRRAALPDRRADPPAQRARLRRRRGGADRRPGGGSRAAAADPGRRARPPPAAAVRPDRAGRRRRTRPAGCSTTSPASAAGLEQVERGRCRRRWPPTGG